VQPENHPSLKNYNC